MAPVGEETKSSFLNTEVIEEDNKKPSRNKMSLVEYRNKEIAMSNQLINSYSGRTNLLEDKIEALIMYKASTYMATKEKKDVNGNPYAVRYVRIRAKEIQNLAGRDDGEMYVEIRNASINLERKIYMIEDRANHMFHAETIYESVHYENGLLEVELKPSMEPLYFNEIKMIGFTKLSLYTMFSFKKAGGLKLYKLLRAVAYGRNLPPYDPALSQEELPVYAQPYTVAELRGKMGFIDLAQDSLRKEVNKKVPDIDKIDTSEKKPVYRKWADFNDRIIKPGIEEINEISDIYVCNVERNVAGRGSKLIGLTFYIQWNKKHFEKDGYSSGRNDKKHDQQENAKKAAAENISEPDDAGMDALFDQMKTIFRGKRSDYRDILKEAGYDIGIVRRAYDCIDKSSPDIADALKHAIKTRMYENMPAVSQEDKDEFMDWLEEMLPFDIKTKELRIIGQEAGYSKERILKIKDVLSNKNATSANITNLITEALKGDSYKNQERNAGYAMDLPSYEESFAHLFTARQLKSIAQSAIRNIPADMMDDKDPWLLMYVTHYYEKIEATPEDTKTTDYKRLLDMVTKDYDSYAASAADKWHKIIGG